MARLLFDPNVANMDVATSNPWRELDHPMPVTMITRTSIPMAL